MNHTIITPSKSWKTFWKELWEYREVFLFLGWRDIVVQYKQTVIGILWVVLRPLLTVAIFTVIFSKIAGIKTEGSPYALMVFSGMLVWQFFVDTFSYGSISFIMNAQLISKVYFPRLILPASRVLCSMIDFGITFCCYLLVSWLHYNVVPPSGIVLLPFFLVWLSLFSFGSAFLK